MTIPYGRKTSVASLESRNQVCSLGSSQGKGKSREASISLGRGVELSAGSSTCCHPRKAEVEVVRQEETGKGLLRTTGADVRAAQSHRKFHLNGSGCKTLGAPTANSVLPARQSRLYLHTTLGKPVEGILQGQVSSR